MHFFFWIVFYFFKRASRTVVVQLSRAWCWLDPAWSSLGFSHSCSWEIRTIFVWKQCILDSVGGNALGQLSQDIRENGLDEHSTTFMEKTKFPSNTWNTWSVRRAHGQWMCGNELSATSARIRADVKDPGVEIQKKKLFIWLCIFLNQQCDFNYFIINFYSLTSAPLWWKICDFMIHCICFKTWGRQMSYKCNHLRAVSMFTHFPFSIRPTRHLHWECDTFALIVNLIGIIR